MKKYFFSFVFIVLCSICFSQEIVHDPINNIPIVSGWLTAIDTLYSNYDMVMNTITQIENQYKTIEQAIDNAKNIDWTNIQFDGDLDIRDEINSATNKINTLLNQANMIKQTLYSSLITTPEGNSYSLADICGAGNAGKGLTGFETCVTDIMSSVSYSFRDAMLAAVGKLSNEQEAAIWTKYGISPSNYYLVSQATNLVKDCSIKCFAKVTDDARDLVRKNKLAAVNPIIEAAMETKTKDGTIPEGALNEATLLASKFLIDECMSIREAIEDASAQVAAKIIADKQIEEAKAEEKLKTIQNEEIKKANLSPAWAYQGKIIPYTK